MTNKEQNIENQQGNGVSPVVMRPCPFCGGNDLIIYEMPSSDKTITWYKILHTATRNCGVSMIDSNKNDLIKLWNNRHDA
jgi:hypothetical protein